MRHRAWIIIGLALIALGGAGLMVPGWRAGNGNTQPAAPIPAASIPSSTENRIPVAASETPAAPVSLPAQAAERVTKKPFGIHIDPQTSPVQPERFSGYHTGTDFETFPSEAAIDVPVHAICDGPLLVKRTATGYGGVAVQACTLDNQAVTVIYGHLRLSSTKASAGDTLKTGEAFGVLGTGQSRETDGERKHLHLGIHRGVTINLLGYVPVQQELNQWIDPCRFVCGTANQ